MTDADASSYWESANNAFPQWIQVDLGSTTSVGKVTLKLPPATAWATRTQTLSVQGSTDGTNFSTVVGSAGYTFDPSTGNTVSISFPATNARYLPAEHHREHRLAGRAALRLRGVRDHGRHRIGDAHRPARRR